MEDPRNIKLSKGILEMKFMKKTKEKVENEDAEGKAMYSNQVTEEMKRSGNLVFIATSITDCKNLVDGRLSFGGMNPDIEKLMANDYNKLIETEEKKKEKDVPDIEMAQGYSTLVESIGKKFKSNKPKSKNKNRKFLKPKD